MSYNINEHELNKIKSGIVKALKFFDHNNKIYLIFKEKSRSKNFEKLIEKITEPSMLNLGAVHILGCSFWRKSKNTLCNSYGELRDILIYTLMTLSLICENLLKNPQGTVMV